MAADWEEVKRLAADLQRAQLGSTVQRLSERNCIEIVIKLIEHQLIDVLFTTDGKEYVTPQQVLREIKDELYVHGGRVNLVDLAQVLHLDFSQVEAKATELVKSEYGLNLVLGQIIDKDYLDRVAEEINDKLQQMGQTSVGDLTKQYDLPADFLQQVIDERLGNIIQGQTDPFDARIIFTEAFIRRQRARIRGALMAITRPTQIMNIINHHNFPERVFHNVVDELISSGQVAGSVAGGRQERAVYIPDIYSKAQTEWVDSFYKQNGYLEYDSLIRMGINEPQSFIKKHLKNEQLNFLNTCAVGKAIFDQIEAAVDEALNTGVWVDIVPILPSILSTSDCHQLLQLVLKGRSKHTTPAHIFCSTIVCAEKFVQDLLKPFDPIMATRAEKDAQKGLPLTNKDFASRAKASKADSTFDGAKDSRKDERRKKAAGGKAGGGAQGRETKTKAVKKKYRARGDSDDSADEEDSNVKKSSAVPFMSTNEIVEELRKRDELEECPPELLEEIAEHIYRPSNTVFHMLYIKLQLRRLCLYMLTDINPKLGYANVRGLCRTPLTKSYQEVVQSVFLASAAATGANRRKTHGEFQEKINGLVVNIRLFEKGIKFFSDDVQTQLSKHLLKTVGVDIVNLIITYLAQEQMIALGEDVIITAEVRNKMITKLPDEMREHLTKLNSAVNGKSVEDFLTAVEAATAPGICDVVIKKLDKKKERQVMFGHRQALLEQLSSTLDAALALHLTALILFQVNTHTMLHASGKFVPQILIQLESQLPTETVQFLQTYQGLVIKQLTLTDDPDQLHQVKGELEALLPKVKEVAVTTKKGSEHD